MLTSKLNSSDVLVLLKMVSHREHRWELSELSLELDTSITDVQSSVLKLISLNLINKNTFNTEVQIFKQFILSELHSLFPVVPGPVVKGTSTGAKCGSVFTEGLPRISIYAWPNPDGWEKGFEIIPLSPTCTFAALNDSRLRNFLAITETMRIQGKHAGNWAEKELDRLLFKM
jgi:hypothetical protein